MASKLASIVVVVSAFHIKASVSVNSNHYHTDHHQLLIVDDSDTKHEELVTKKLHRIAMGYRTHADKLRRTAEMEYELASKVEQCFMMTSGGGSGSYESNNSQSKNNLLLLLTKLLLQFDEDVWRK